MPLTSFLSLVIFPLFFGSVLTNFFGLLYFVLSRRWWLVGGYQFHRAFWQWSVGRRKAGARLLVNFLNTSLLEHLTKSKHCIIARVLAVAPSPIHLEDEEGTSSQPFVYPICIWAYSLTRTFCLLKLIVLNRTVDVQ